MMTAMAQLKATLEKAQSKSDKLPVPVYVKHDKDDDEVLANFIKSLM